MVIDFRTPEIVNVFASWPRHLLITQKNKIKSIELSTRLFKGWFECLSSSNNVFIVLTYFLDESILNKFFCGPNMSQDRAVSFINCPFIRSTNWSLVRGQVSQPLLEQKKQSKSIFQEKENVMDSKPLKIKFWDKCNLQVECSFLSNSPLLNK